ncbi:hypothetical protein Ancab_002315 [Ancistrocladus abbreviatus]
MDSVSRVQCLPEEIHRASSEKEEHKSGEIHASRKAGEQVSQKQDGASGDTPLRILFQRQRKLKKRCIPSKAPSTQTSDGESVGPTFVGPTNTEEGIGFTRRDKAHLIHETSVQGVLAQRENSSKMQQLSQIRFLHAPQKQEKTFYVERRATNPS